MTQELTLAEKLLALAQKDNLPHDHELVKHAEALQKLELGVSSAKRVLGTWARARRAYCNYTGEPLI